MKSVVMTGTLDSHVPGGALETQWDRHKGDLKLVSPAN